MGRTKFGYLILFKVGSSPTLGASNLLPKRRGCRTLSAKSGFPGYLKGEAPTKEDWVANKTPVSPLDNA